MNWMQEVTGVDELKPCPFCGREAIMSADKNKAGPRYYVRCDNHTCSVIAFTLCMKTEEEAAKVWNRRADNG